MYFENGKYDWSLKFEQKKNIQSIKGIVNSLKIS